jgi:transcriptional regulator with PAS, ATPase and Fis domain
MAVTLVAISGPIKGQVTVLADEPISIGRAGTNQLSIGDAALSRLHCRVSSDAGRITIRDLESLNGTFVNGLPIRDRVLEHGDQIKVGHSLFVLVVSDGGDVAGAADPLVAQNSGLPTIELSPGAVTVGVRRPAPNDARLAADPPLRHTMVGETARMRDIYRIIARAARSDSTVLICGESGTGKELAARAIHMNSRRAAGPFVSINSAALTETLLESELFGHEKGAFTGAIAQKKGRIELADGGTLFLDEIGELAPALQAKLLRVIQERELERVGGTKTLPVDVRIVAATNKNLEEAVRKGEFRGDLFYRLNVITLTMPPLREKRDDIPLLASYFIAKHAERCGRQVVGLSREARAHLMSHDWPGNVRELENAIERAVVLGSSDRILPEDLPEPVMEAEAAGGVTSGYHAAIREAKRRVVLEAILNAGGRYCDAAKALGVHANYLHRLMRTLNLREELGK